MQSVLWPSFAFHFLFVTYFCFATHLKETAKVNFIWADVDQRNSPADCTVVGGHRRFVSGVSGWKSLTEEDTPASPTVHVLLSKLIAVISAVRWMLAV